MPNEKYRNMFGVERNGYGCERVDLYLAQLEVAFKKIREDNRTMKRELNEQSMNQLTGSSQGNLFPPENNELSAQLEQQGQYIMQLQAQLAEQQERGQRLHAQLAEQQERSQHLQAQLASAPQPGEASGAQGAEVLMAQIAALRSEADALRQQLRRQSAAAPSAQPAQFMNEEEQQNLIGKVLVDARARADETLRTAQQEAEAVTRKARQRVEELRAEQERVQSQLQRISFGLRNVLRESAGAEYQQRGEEFAAS